MDAPAARRERLQTLRREAAAGAEPGVGSPASPAQLFNPLAHPPPPPAEIPTPPPRFDYYTDPVSAFSGAKRRCPSGRGGGSSFSPLSRPDGGPRNYHITNTQVPATPQFYVNQSPDQCSQPMAFPVSQSNQWRSPVQFGSPYSGHRGTQFSGPAVWNASGGSSGYMYAPNPTRGGFRSPSYGQQVSPRTSFGRGIRPMNNPGIGSPRSNSGSGARPYGGSPNPGRSRGRGRGFDGGHLGLQEFKSMLEDPWKDLKPVVGNILVPKAGSDFWLPESLKTKKTDNVAESSNKSKTQSSLAEYLAQSFEEATNDETTT